MGSTLKLAKAAVVVACAVAMIAVICVASAGADSASPPMNGRAQQRDVVPWKVTGHTATTVKIHGYSVGLCGIPHPPGTASIRWSGRFNGMRKAIITLSKDERPNAYVHFGVCEGGQIVDATVNLGRPVSEVALFDGSARPPERRSLARG